MADNFVQFAEMIQRLSPEEEQWLREQFRSIRVFGDQEFSEDEPDEEDLPSGEPDYVGPRFLRDHPDFDPSCDVLDFEFGFHDDSDTPDGWGHYLMLFAEDHGDMTHVAWLLQKFLRQFRPEQSWSLTYAASCSKPRVGEFGGGAVFVTAEEITYFSSWDFVQEHAAAFRRRQDVAGLVQEAQRLGIEAEDLDDVVQDEASRPASDINNGGLEEQIAFLVERRGVDSAHQTLQEAATNKKEPNENHEG